MPQNVETAKKFKIPDLKVEKMREVVESVTFQRISLTFIILNVGFLASAHYPSSEVWEFASDLINLIFTVYFMMELIIRVLGYGLRRFCSDWFNVFDGILVLIGVCDVVYASITLNFARLTNPGFGGFTVLKAFKMTRSLYVLRGVRHLNGTRRALTVVVKTLPSLFWMLLPVGLVTYIYAIVGMHLFGAIELESFFTFESFGMSVHLCSVICLRCVRSLQGVSPIFSL